MFNPPSRRTPADLFKDFPWLCLAAAACTAWVSVLAAIALYSASQERTQQAHLPPVIPPLAANAPVVVPHQPPKIAEPVMDPDAPAKPAAPAQEEAQIDPIAPPIKILPERDPGNDQGPVDELAFKKDLDGNNFANCAEIGTDIRFVKDPPAAFQRARTEKKMVFMIHLAGNLEDKEFT